MAVIAGSVQLTLSARGKDIHHGKTASMRKQMHKSIMLNESCLLDQKYWEESKLLFKQGENQFLNQTVNLKEEFHQFYICVKESPQNVTSELHLRHTWRDKLNDIGCILLVLHLDPREARTWWFLSNFAITSFMCHKAPFQAPILMEQLVHIFLSNLNYLSSTGEDLIWFFF